MSWSGCCVARMRGSSRLSPPPYCWNGSGEATVLFWCSSWKGDGSGNMPGVDVVVAFVWAGGALLCCKEAPSPDLWSF